MDIGSLQLDVIAAWKAGRSRREIWEEIGKVLTYKAVSMIVDREFNPDRTRPDNWMNDHERRKRAQLDHYLHQEAGTKRCSCGRLMRGPVNPCSACKLELALGMVP